MSLLIKRDPPRRDVLRGLIGGAAVSVALPFLDVFLDDTGRALAATGAPIPVRFGTWFWSMGHTPGHAIGPNFELLEECKALTPHKQHLNYFGYFNSPLDGRPNHVHHSGWASIRTGVAPPRPGDIAAPTIDVLVADQIGGATRFRSLEMSSTGAAKDTYSARGTHSRNASEASAVALYARIFGPDFTDPNLAEFKPNPDLMLQESVLSGVGDQLKRFGQRLGAADKARMEEYATSIRQIENQLALQQQKPPPADACKVPEAPGETPAAFELPNMQASHRAMIKITALALACNQTRVFNMAMADPLSSLRKPGAAYTHHTLTHEEPIDKDLGYQPEAFWFNCRLMEEFALAIDTFAQVKEGDGTLLDNTLIFAHSETSFAKLHAVDNIPMFTVGRAGGRLRTGQHIVGNGDPVSRVGLTVMQALGVPLERWGQGSMETAKTISEILA